MTITDDFLREELDKWKDEVENEKVSAIKNFFKPNTLKNNKIKSINDDTWFCVYATVEKKAMREIKDGMHFAINWDVINIPLEMEYDEFNKTTQGDKYLFVFHKKAEFYNKKFNYEDVILRFPQVTEYIGENLKEI